MGFVPQGWISLENERAMLGIPTTRMFPNLPSELVKKHSQDANDIAARSRKAYAARDIAMTEQEALIREQIIPQAVWEDSIDREVAANDLIWDIRKDHHTLITLISDDEILYNENIAQREKRKRIKNLRKELAELESNLEN